MVLPVWLHGWLVVVEVCHLSLIGPNTSGLIPRQIEWFFKYWMVGFGVERTVMVRLASSDDCNKMGTKEIGISGLNFLLWNWWTTFWNPPFPALNDYLFLLARARPAGATFVTRIRQLPRGLPTSGRGSCRLQFQWKDPFGKMVLIILLAIDDTTSYHFFR